jgi:predicted outer membrane protein
MWGLALAVGWLLNAGLGWSADMPMTSVVLGTLHHAALKEIAMAKVGQRNARSRQVKDLADTIIEDNTAADKKIVALAREEHIDLDASTPPPNPDDVSSLEGVVDFDSTFAKVMHDDQERELAHASAAFDGTPDPKLRFLLGELIPQMRAHRDMAKLILDEGAPRVAL